MRPQWVTDWLEALRSGKYAKGNYRLRKYNNFCCLGVLCEVQGVPAEVSVPTAGIYSYLGKIALFPPTLEEKLDLTTEFVDQLATTNDNTSTFDEVIKLIEEKYPE